MRNKLSFIFLITAGVFLIPIAPGANAEAIIADHLAATDFINIPHAYIEQVKTTQVIHYGHTSHGSQIVSGMTILKDSSSLYDFKNGEGTLYMSEISDDLGHLGDTSWVPITRARLADPSYGFNVVMWSWCGGCSDNTEEGIDIYLNAMNGLEEDYPDVTFIYMTGHLDGTGVDGNLYRRNNQIRAYCQANDKILFDFADIESYDPDGNYYPDETDYCYWCSDWCAVHDCHPCDICAHSQCFNCYLKGKAFWWMMARIVGWIPDPDPDCCEGVTGNVNCSVEEEPDISDITRLIDYLYISRASLCCPEEADINVSGGEPDISDITRLIDYLYISQAPLDACP